MIRFVLRFNLLRSTLLCANLFGIVIFLYLSIFEIFSSLPRCRGRHFSTTVRHWQEVAFTQRAHSPNTATGIIAARKPISRAIFIASANTSEIGTVERASEKQNANTPHLPVLHTYTFRKFSFRDRRRAPETVKRSRPKPINVKLFRECPSQNLQFQYRFE